MNDGEQVPTNARRERTNSDNLECLFHQQSDIQEELRKPTTQHVTSFTENMVYMHPSNDTRKS